LAEFADFADAQLPKINSTAVRHAQAIAAQICLPSGHTSAMDRSSNSCVKLLLAGAMLLAPGCRSRDRFVACGEGLGCDPYVQQATAIEYPALSDCSVGDCNAAIHALAPRLLTSSQPANYRDLTLAETVQVALAQSTVLSDLGGAVIRSPDATQTVYDASIVETDAARGIEAALSEFDAQFQTNFNFENNDRAINNEFFGGGTRLLTQDTGALQSQIIKRSVTGTQLAARHIAEFDSNNAPGNAFVSAWTTKLETEIRHPLLQGSGMEFNRIAGPGTSPGVYNGVLLARVKTDVELTDFEIAVRNYVSNIENAYWDLYFAYRDLDAKIAARDAALDTWRRVRALYDAGRRGGEAEKEAQAREQYYRFEEEVQNALTGRLFDGTRVGNGSQGGTFRGAGGVHVCERRLRRLMNLPAADGELLRPADEPVLVEIAFDWHEVAGEAVSRRAELRRQKWNIRRRELELIASKNHLLPRLDAVGRYRFRGFGDDLIDSNSNGAMRFDNAYDDMLTGDFQEWQLGFELDVPIGFRRAHTAVRNAELLLARERALLGDSQNEVIHDVAGSVAEVDRAYQVALTSFNRLVASREQLAAVSAAFEADKVPLDLLLDAQRRLSEAESRYYRALAEHAIAIKNVHFSKGTLLEFDGVFLAEGPWPGAAYRDADELERRRGRARSLNYASTRAATKVSNGPYDQHPHEAIVAPAAMPSETGLESPLSLPAGGQERSFSN
jgi:hypothetical protein